MATQLPAPARSVSCTSELAGVKGLDGWLFDQRAVTLMSGKARDDGTVDSADTASIAAAWYEQLSNDWQWLKGQGIRYIHLCVPEKLGILDEFHRPTIDALSYSPMRQLSVRYKSRLSCLLDPSAYLTQQKKQPHPLYWKSDTRWTPWACYMSYQLLCGQLRVELNRQLLGYPYSEAAQAMNLNAGVTPALSESVRHYRLQMRSRRRFANKLTQMRETLLPVNHPALSHDCYGRGAHAVFENRHDDASKLTVMLFGDANSGDGRTLLTGMLAETFSELHFVWSPSLDREYIEQVKPDIVITQACELQMSRPPVRGLDVTSAASESLLNLMGGHQEDRATSFDGRAEGKGTGVSLAQAATKTRVILATEEYDLQPPVCLQEHDSLDDPETRMRTNEVTLTDISDATVYFTGADWLVQDAQGVEVLRHLDVSKTVSGGWRLIRPRRLSGLTLMFGTSAGAHCYYHWMMELLPKLGLLEREGISVDAIDHFLVRRITGDWQRQTLLRFGITADRIVETEKQPRWRCDRLLHVGINCGINLKMHRFIPQWMKHLYPADTSGLPRLKLYITRPQGVRRGISNEAEILPLLHEAGFTTMAMEGLSVAEQAALLSRVDVLMSPHGGALTNMVFCRPGITVVEMFSRHVFPYYYGLAANCGHHYYAILENPLEDYPRLVNSRVAQSHADNQHETAELDFQVPLEAVKRVLKRL